MADLPDPCAQALSAYILVTSFYDPWRHKNNVVSLLAVFSIVTQRMWVKEENPLSMKEVNSFGTSVCKSMFIAIYTTLKIPLNMEKTGAGSLDKYFVIQLYSKK